MKQASSTRFNALYDDLASKWAAHQDMRRDASAAPADLYSTWADLEQARAEMWAWWKANRSGVRGS